MSGVRIEIEAYCEGTGFCTKICPEVFHLDPATNLAVPVKDLITDPGLLEKIENAETTCPARALVLTVVTEG